MLPSRKSLHGRYRSAYPELQRQAQHLASNHVQAMAQHQNSAAIYRNLADDSIYLEGKEVDKVRVTCIILGGEDFLLGKLNSMDICILKFYTSWNFSKSSTLDELVVSVHFAENGPSYDTKNENLKIYTQPCPKNLIHGDPRKDHTVQTHTFSPKIQIFGSGGELGGYERTRETTLIHSWSFGSYWLPDKHDDLNVAQWRWTADQADPEIRPVRPLYSGVVLKNHGSCFWVGSKVELKLKRSFSNIWKRYVGRSDTYNYKAISVEPKDTDVKTAIEKLDEEISQFMYKDN